MQQCAAERFAAEWIAAWNSHDLNRILEHYTDEFEFSSPFMVEIAGEPSGKLKGKAAVGAYWSKALARSPSLKFELQTVLWGVATIIIQYRRHDGRPAAEWFELDGDGKVIRSAAQYGA